jgi:hypothetical protein
MEKRRFNSQRRKYKIHFSRCWKICNWTD